MPDGVLKRWVLPRWVLRRALVFYKPVLFTVAALAWALTALAGGLATVAATKVVTDEATVRSEFAGTTAQVATAPGDASASDALESAGFVRRWSVSAEISTPDASAAATVLFAGDQVGAMWSLGSTVASSPAASDGWSVSRSLASALGVTVGDEVEFRVGGTTLTGPITRIHVVGGRPDEALVVVAGALPEVGIEPRWFGDERALSDGALLQLWEAERISARTVSSLLADSAQTSSMGPTASVRWAAYGLFALLVPLLVGVYVLVVPRFAAGRAGLSAAGAGEPAANALPRQLFLAAAVVGAVLGLITGFVAVIPSVGWIGPLFDQYWTTVRHPWSSCLGAIALALVVTWVLLLIPARPSRGGGSRLGHSAALAIALAVAGLSTLGAHSLRQGGSALFFVTLVLFGASAPIIGQAWRLLRRPALRQVGRRWSTASMTLLIATSAATAAATGAAALVTASGIDSWHGVYEMAPRGWMSISTLSAPDADALSDLWVARFGSAEDFVVFGLLDDSQVSIRATTPRALTCLKVGASINDACVTDDIGPIAVGIDAPAAMTGLTQSGQVGLVAFDRAGTVVASVAISAGATDELSSVAAVVTSADIGLFGFQRGVMVGSRSQLGLPA